MNVDNPLALYRQMVKRVIEGRLTTRIDNSSNEHAIVLIDELVRHAKSKVDIYCKRLSIDIWGSVDVVDAIKHEIDNKVVFRILTQEAIDVSDSYNLLMNYQNAEIKQYLGERLDINFVIIDDEMFRIEPDNLTRQGFAFARNDEYAKPVSAAFDRMWSGADATGPTKDGE